MQEAFERNQKSEADELFGSFGGEVHVFYDAGLPPLSVRAFVGASTGHRELRCIRTISTPEGPQRLFNRQLRLLPSPNCNFIHQRVALQPSATRLRNGVIIDVDDNFFTTAFFTMGLFYSLGRHTIVSCWKRWPSSSARWRRASAVSRRTPR